MKLSVIVISYNELDYLPKAIGSCFGQKDFDDFEIIIADDGSSDGSVEWIESLAAHMPGKVRFFVNDRMDGERIPSIRVSNSIKKAMGIASGDYLVCLSGDDWFCASDKFSTQVAWLDTHPEHIACVSDYKMVWPDGTEKRCTGYGMQPLMLWGSTYVHISAFLFRRTVFERGLLEHFCDDTGLIYSIACAGKWHHVPQVTFAYRQRDKSIMHKADRLELCILEVLLFQDISREPRDLWISTLSHYARPMLTVFLSKKKLEGHLQYNKYLDFSAKCAPDYLNAFARWDELSLGAKLQLLWLIGQMGAVHVILWVMRRCVVDVYQIKDKVFIREEKNECKS